MICPCGLTRGELLSAHIFGDGGVCTAFKKGSRNERCGELLADHPTQAPETVITQLFLLRGVIKFAKLRGGCRQRLYRLAEQQHAKTRVGTSLDGISYQGITSHLQFSLVFTEGTLAEGFRFAVKRIPLEYRKRKHGDIFSGDIVVPDISVEFQPIQRVNWEGDLDLVEEDQCQSVGGEAELSLEHDVHVALHTSVVSVNAETQLRMLESNDSRMFFRQKPEKCCLVGDFNSMNNPNNVIYMSRFLRQQWDAIESTEGIPQFYIRYVAHSAQHQQGLINNELTPVFETTIDIVFKDEEAKEELIDFFNNPTNIDPNTIRMVAYFPNPLEFEHFSSTRAEETCAKWASYDGALNT